MSSPGDRLRWRNRKAPTEVIVVLLGLEEEVRLVDDAGDVDEEEEDIVDMGVAYPTEWREEEVAQS